LIFILAASANLPSEMFPEAETLPHLICSRPMFIGGANDEADQHGGATTIWWIGGREFRRVADAAEFRPACT
jgi:hypothetical protein